jgi:hypothetical protein
VIEALTFFLFGVAVATIAVVCRRRYAEFYGQKPEDYDDSFPILHIKEHLAGRMICEGAIFGPLGRVTSTFRAEWNISWEGDTGTMRQSFRYNDGTTQERAWLMTLGRHGAFTCTAEDVVGEGEGFVAGPTVQMLYKIRLPENAGGHLLDTVDWMYLTPSGTIANRSQFRKFGFKVAELIATIRPAEDK